MKITFELTSGEIVTYVFKSNYFQGYLTEFALLPLKDKLKLFDVIKRIFTTNNFLMTIEISKEKKYCYSIDRII